MVVEPSSIDRSLVVENCITALGSEVRQAILRGHIHLVIYYAYEAFPFWYREFMSSLERSLHFFRIPPSNVTFIFGDQNISVNYKEYSEGHFIYFDWETDSMISFDHFGPEFQHYLEHIKAIPREWERQQVPPFDQEVELRLRPFCFLCLNGGARKHRRYFVAELVRRGLERKGLVSYISKYFEDVTQTLYLRPDLHDYSALLEFHSAWERSEHNLKIPLDQTEGWWHNRGMMASHYSDSYFSIVMETFPDRPSFFLTEKVLKPIFNLHPFIIVGAPGSLHYIRSLGYETFPELFDESYDQILDDGERFRCILDQVDGLIRSKKRLHALYDRLRPRLLRNRELLLTKEYGASIDRLFSQVNDRALRAKHRKD